MNLRRILDTTIWPSRRHAWPLLAVTAPMYALLFGLVLPLRRGLVGLNWHVHGFCAFLGQTPVVWALATVWFVIDAFLIVQMERALNGGGEPARPAKLFLLWQCAKLAFLFLLFSVLIAHGPLIPRYPRIGHGGP